MALRLIATPLHPWQDPGAKPYVQLVDISKSYGQTLAIDGLNLSVYKNEFFALLGPSGCGKTTLLRILAGLEQPSSGRIIVDGQDVTSLPPYERPINMMFQSYALFPHMTVFENVAFGLRQEGLSEREIRKRVEETIELVHMRGFEGRYPRQLSGGQSQRVALARSLVKRPKVLLLDEPLAALDRILREKTQFELVNLQERLGITFIMVTHDQAEAMTMSTRMAIMEDGYIRQVGTPGEVYEYPNCTYVAKFIGTMNMFEGIVVEESEEHLLVQSPDFPELLAVGYTSEVNVGAQVMVAVRPEKLMISKGEPEDQAFNVGHGVVKDIAYSGDTSVFHIRMPSGRMVLAKQSNLVRLAERSVTWDDDVYLFWSPQNSALLVTE